MPIARRGWTWWGGRWRIARRIRLMWSVACSALRRRYRDHIRATAGGMRFVHLDLPKEVAAGRVGARPGHFMPASLVADQFATLEPPGADEVDVRTVDATLPLPDVIARALARD